MIYTTYIFCASKGTEINGKPIYGDMAYSTEREYRPMVGDMIIFNDFVLGMRGVEIEHLVCIGPSLFHAYCNEFTPDASHPPYYGLRGDKPTLLAHIEDQATDFPERYQVE